MRKCCMIHHMPQTELLTSPAVAVLIRRSPRTVHRLVSDGKLTPYQVISAGRNGTFLFTRAEVARYLATTVEVAA